MSAEVHCKGCGEAMTEGRAYELGNHRWHVKCFRCSSCNDQLTSHTNMLVLGDGTLVCANCSYTCAVCSKKIMDMAVLTNDQAFCASCFVCRNCKKRIDDLQYARTSQGIFCMSCHSALLARKRQRQLQKQQQQQLQQQQQNPQQESQKDLAAKRSSVRIPSQGTVNPESDAAFRTSSNSESSKSSIVSSRSYNRNKDLPGLPTENNAIESKSSSELSIPKRDGDSSSGYGKTLRVPRKQLAPSAFQNFENDDSSNLSLSVIQRMVSAQSDKDADLGSDSTRKNSDSGAADTSSASGGVSDATKNSIVLVDNHNHNHNHDNTAPRVDSSADSDATAKEDQTGSSSIGHPDHKVPRVPPPTDYFNIGGAQQAEAPHTPRTEESRAEKTDAQLNLLNGSEVAKLPDPLTIDTPPRSVIGNDEFPTPDTSQLMDNSNNYMSPDTLNIPQRSQRRPVSPAKSWRSSAANSEHSPRTVRSPAAYTTLPLDRQVDSPTQAAAPQQTPRSPFSRWWHKRDPSAASTASTGSGYIPVALPVQSHKRSVSENTTVNSDLAPVLNNENLSEALALVALERDRANEAEAKLQQFERRDKLEAELAELEKQVAKMREDHKLLSSRNKQLYEMNAELQRQTLEKFGPNTLWGSQNPLPQEQSSSASQSSASTVVGSAYSRDPRDALNKENPLVTRLDDPQASGGYSSTSSSTSGGAGAGGSGNGSGALQAQFLPFKTAKQWFFRRPNRMERDRGQSANQFASSPYIQGANNTGVYGSGGNNDSNPNVSSQKGYGMNGDTSMNGIVTILNGPGNTGNLPTSGRAQYQNQESQKGVATESLLGDTLRARVQIDKAPVPYFVTRCFAEVERRGLDTEGVYRKPGSKSQVDAILEQFGPNGDPDAAEKLLENGEIQAITSAVKQYLRRLLDPVITYDCYDAFIASGSSKNVDYLKRTIKSLPQEHQATLKVVALHLALVASHESANLMNIRNLAMVFAPTIARDESGDREIPDMQARNDATHMVIVNASELFDANDDELL